MLLLRIVSFLVLCFVSTAYAVLAGPCATSFDDPAEQQALEADCGGDMIGLVACAAPCAAGCACISTAGALAAAKLETAVPVTRLPELLPIRARAPDTAPPKRPII